MIVYLLVPYTEGNVKPKNFEYYIKSGISILVFIRRINMDGTILLNRDGTPAVALVKYSEMPILLCSAKMKQPDTPRMAILLGAPPEASEGTEP